MTSPALNVKKLAYEIEKIGLAVPKQIRKRDGSLSTFDPKRIAQAVDKCLLEFPSATISGTDIATAVTRAVSARKFEIPTVEDIQDMVVYTLFAAGEFSAADDYQSYRERRKSEREDRPIPSEVKEAFDNDRKYFPTPSQQFMFYDKYSRYNHDLGRRETWVETVGRSVDHLKWLVETHSPKSMETMYSQGIWEEIHNAVLNMEVMPSMRLLAMAGEAARRNGLAIYNCSFMPVKDIDSFVEALLISMAGCGVGYSVESQYVEQLPRIKRQTGVVHYFEIEDTTEGWGEAVRFGLRSWFNGEDVEFDSSFLRPKGSILITKGGRASGPEPLLKMLTNIRERILSRQGSFLTTVDAHYMMCNVGEAAVAGGVRRTAMIALFDFWDKEMRSVKTGDFDPIFWNANNSTVWPEGISDLEVIEQMTEMIRGKAGEPGIFSRTNANATKPSRRQSAEFGTNPCGEINLRPYGLCNLSIAVARPGDSFEALQRKVGLAALIGTIQSLTTNFPGMREEWAKNCEEERLLGVDLSGQMDHEVLQNIDETGEMWRALLQNYVVHTNNLWAEEFGINPAAATTCDKPAGNSSEFLDMASGIRRRHSPYFIRNMRLSATSPLFKVLRHARVPMDPENGQTKDNATTWVVHFPKKSPEGALTADNMSAIDQCEFWLLNKVYWTEHNPSCTITYKEDEILDLINWIVKHKDLIGGLSFLPADDTVYTQMPYETLTKYQYEEAMANFPKNIDYSKIYRYELDDMTTASKELSCFSGACEV